MVSITDSVLVTPNRMPEGLIRVDVTTPTTSRAADTFAITLSTYGIKDPLGVECRIWNNESSFHTFSTQVKAARSGANNDTFTVTLPANPSGWDTVPNTYFITIYGTERATHSGDLPAF